MRIASQRRRSTSTGPRRQPAMPSASVCDDRVSARAGQVRFTDERTRATSAPPQFAEGLIVGGSGAATGVTAVSEEPKLSHYTVTGAQIGWTDSRGKVRRLPISALRFDSAQGITIELNGHAGRDVRGVRRFELPAERSAGRRSAPQPPGLSPDSGQQRGTRARTRRPAFRGRLRQGDLAARSAGNRPFPEPGCPVRPPEIGP